VADYTAPDEQGKDVTHYPDDGHVQCASRNFMGITREGFTLSDNFKVKAVDEALKDTRDVLFGEPMDRAEYERNLARIAEVRMGRMAGLNKNPKTFQETLREINEYGWESGPVEAPMQPTEGAEIFLRSIGVDLDKEHHRDTPRRLAEAMKELTTRHEFKFTTFEAKSQNMVTLGPIPFYTLCAHHTLPFHGNAWIGYVPDERIAGLSKFARAVEYVTKGFHVQEELTTELHGFLNDKLAPKGLAVVMKAEHMCMSMRGVRASGVITTTSEVSGVFADHTRTAKAEFLEWIRG
jgi:GTP cyclohydrolase IA